MVRYHNSIYFYNYSVNINKTQMSLHQIVIRIIIFFLNNACVPATFGIKCTDNKNYNFAKKISWFYTGTIWLDDQFFGWWFVGKKCGQMWKLTVAMRIMLQNKNDYRSLLCFEIINNNFSLKFVCLLANCSKLNF